MCRLGHSNFPVFIVLTILMIIGSIAAARERETTHHMIETFVLIGT